MDDHDYQYLTGLFQALANPTMSEPMTWFPIPRELRDNEPIRSHP